MTGWQLQAMVEADAEATWEALNSPDPCEDKMKASAVVMIEAARFIEIAEDRLVEALEELTDTPMEPRVGALLEALQDLRCDIQAMANKFERGERD